jgi:hypothetical protein
MHLNARPAVATISGWSWDRGEDGDNLHVAMVRFTTEDGREFDDAEVSSICADRPGPLGGQVDIFYDPDEPSWVLTRRPAASEGKVPPAPARTSTVRWRRSAGSARPVPSLAE